MISNYEFHGDEEEQESDEAQIKYNKELEHESDYKYKDELE